MRKLSLCVLALGLGLVSTTNAASTSVSRYTQKGNTAQGSADQNDDCISAALFISASEETTKDGTNRTTSRSMIVSYGGRDLCNNLSWGGFAQLPLTTRLDTQTVTLDFDIAVDFANTETDERFTRRLVGSATWVGTGDLEKSRETQITRTETLRLISRSRGTSREADLTVDATLQGEAITFQPGTGTLGTTKQGTVEITRF